MSSVRVRWRALVASLAVLSLVLCSLAPAVALAQSGGVTGGHAQVIAQGVDFMPRVPVVWRVTETRAAPADEADVHSRTLGFAVGEGEPTLVTDRDADDFILVVLAHPYRRYVRIPRLA